MLPAMQHHTAWAQVRVGGIQAIETIGHTISPLVALGDKGTTHGR